MCINRVGLTFFLLLTFATSCFAADHYVSPAGTGTWADSVNAGSPCSLETAFSNAAAGDTVYLRGGTYQINTTVSTVNAGTSGNRIVFKNYPGETPNLVSDGLGNTIMIESEYWTLDGIHIRATNMLDHDHGVVRVGENNSGSFLHVINCTIELLSTAGRDNVAAISLQADRCNYTLAQNNTLIGSGSTDDNFVQIGIQYLGGGCVGVKILNNDISKFAYGIYVKHANGDISLDSGAEIAYNYIHSCFFDGSTLNPSGMYGQPTYIDIHDNITDRMLFGDNGGGAQGAYSIINHNTIIAPHGIELWNPSEGPIHDFNITNNIFPDKITYGTTEADNSWDYNMYGDDPAIGPNDIGATVPVYVGGANPTSISGFALDQSSPGYLAGSDNKNIGADTTLVGLTYIKHRKSSPSSFSGVIH